MSSHFIEALRQWLPLRDAHAWVLGAVIQTRGSVYRKTGALLIFAVFFLAFSTLHCPTFAQSVDEIYVTGKRGTHAGAQISTEGYEAMRIAIQRAAEDAARRGIEDAMQRFLAEQQQIKNNSEQKLQNCIDIAKLNKSLCELNATQRRRDNILKCTNVAFSASLLSQCNKAADADFDADKAACNFNELSAQVSCKNNNI
jgi:hypothetical protein